MKTTNICTPPPPFVDRWRKIWAPVDQAVYLKVTTVPTKIPIMRQRLTTAASTSSIHSGHQFTIPTRCTLKKISTVHAMILIALQICLAMAPILDWECTLRRKIFQIHQEYGMEIWITPAVSYLPSHHITVRTIRTI